MPWTKTKNPWSVDTADSAAEKNVQQSNMLATIWGQQTPASSKEDGITQRMLVDRLRESVRRLGQSGFSTLGAFSFSAGYPANAFRAALSRAVVDGLTLIEVGTGLNSETDSQYTLPAPPGTGTRNDLVFLEVFLVEVPGSTASTPVSTNKPSTTAVWKYGNVLFGGTNPADDINEVNYEIRRRVQVQYRIRTVGGVDFATYPNGLGDPVVTAQGPLGSPSGLVYAAAAADVGLWVAGNGSAAHQATLGTLDGYVYAIPIAKVARTAGVTEIQSGNVTDLRKSWGGISIASVLTTKGDLLSRSSASLVRLPVGADGAALLGDASQTAGLTWQVLPFQCGRLQHVSATQIKLAPFNGARIPLKVGSLWTLYTIPAAGLTAANTNVRINGSDGQNLAASTVYLVCLTDVNGTKVLEFIPLATGHGADTDMGVEIITGSPTRTLVGMIRTDGSSQFVSTPRQPFVVSWLNQRLIVVNAGPGGSTASATYVEVDSTNRGEFLVLGSQNTVLVSSAGDMYNSAAVAFQGDIGQALDNTTTPDAAVSQGSNAGGDYNYPRSWAMEYGYVNLAEGYHYATLLFRTTAGTVQTGARATPRLSATLMG